MTPCPQPDTVFDRFAASLDRPDVMEYLRGGLIGEGIPVPGPNGAHPLIYADYVASGRALRQVEQVVTEDILPIYSNSHTEASFCGQAMSRLRRQARDIILTSCGGTGDYDVIFTGSGATAGINRLVSLLVTPDAPAPLVLIGPYEHHSNILPWRESGAEVIELPEAETGGPDLTILETTLQTHKTRKIIASFSAMSNVTGITTDVTRVSHLLKSYGAISLWDYAGGAPYLPINLSRDRMDAIVLSPHKFIGGPGASGVLIVRRDIVTSAKPTLPGGGTVRFVSPWAHDYATSLIAREEAGTPNVIGDLRAALCFMVKDAMGQDTITNRLSSLRKRAETAWAALPALRILGNRNAPRLPVFSFTVTAPDGTPVHQQLVTRMLSDFYGIQARGGCACAGPYAHRLLGIDRDRSDALRADILGGHEIAKPGWTRLAFSVLMTDEKADRIIDAVREIANCPATQRQLYAVDTSTARFSLGAA